MSRPAVLLASLVVSLVCLPWVGQRATAAPLLQLYAEGATYDSSSESWTISPAGSSAGEPFVIWAIGNVGGPGGKGTIFNVRLAVVYDAAADDAGGIQIELTPVTTGGFGGFVDPSTPIKPYGHRTVTDGSVPLLGDFRPLPNHGQYGDGRHWQEFKLGDFSLIDSPVADFIGDFPTTMFPDAGQINAYAVRVTNSGTHPTRLHFDLYDTVVSKTNVRGVFAPFSHDADLDAHIMPEPASLTAWSLALIGGASVAGVRRLRRRGDRTV
jgi:hypothetical protein